MKPRLGTLAGLYGGVAGMITLGWLFGLPELTALSVAMGVVALLALVHLSAGPPAPRIDASVSSPAVPRGTPARFKLGFTGDGNSRSRPVRVSGDFGTAGRRSVAVDVLQAGQTTRVDIEIPTPHRGVIRFGPLQVNASDPLMMWRRTTVLPLDAVLVVRPRVHPLPGVFGRGGMKVGTGRPSAALSGGHDAEVDLVGLRPYVPGDDVRRIHWRTSARRNEPHVVQVEPPVGPASVLVIVDTRIGFCDADRFELVVEAAASVCCAAFAAGRPLRIATTAGTDLRLPATPQGLSDALDALARIAQGHTPALGSALDVLDTVGTQVVVCTGNPEVVHDPAITGDSLVVCWDGRAPLGDSVVRPLQPAGAGRRGAPR